MLPIDNQPIVFNLDKSCLYPFTYKQKVNHGDKTQFQFRLETCFASPQLVVNGNFNNLTNSDNNALNGWTQVGTGFTYGAGTAIKTGSATALIRQNILTIGNYYKCVIDISSITSDESSNIAEVRIGAGTRFFPLSTGTNELYGRCLGSPSFEIRCNNNSQITVDNVVVYEVNTNYVITIGDEQGNPLLGIYLESVNSPYYDPTYFSFDGPFVTVTLDWNDLSVGSGCYTIGVIDPCEGNAAANIVNYDFSQGHYGWNVYSTDTEYVVNFTTYASQSVVYFYTTLGVFDTYVYNNTILTQGVEYLVTFYIARPPYNSQISVNTGSVSPTPVLDNTGTFRSSEGVYTEVFTPSQSDSVIILRFKKSGSTPCEGIVGYVQVRPSNISSQTPDFISEPLHLGSHDCTKVLRMSNDVDAYGFSFRDFAPRLRVRCDLRSGTDRSESEWYRTSGGNKKRYYADVIFSQDLTIEPIPEYLHNFLRYCSKSSYFYIDGLSYFIEDDEFPDITWNKQKTLGSLTMDVSENKLQLLQNKSGESTGGNSGSSGIGSGGGSSSGGSSAGVTIGTNTGKIIGVSKS